jgi:DegV family protein with EDD domain
MSPLRIVTDGGADLPPGLMDLLDIRVVQGTVYLDGTEWWGTNDEFWRATRAGDVPSTAPPSVEQFCNAFCDREPTCAVVVSGELSHTLEHAEHAATERPSVGVIDSRSLSVGTGLLALLAAEAAADTPELGRLRLMLPSLVARLHVFALIENVDNLIRGGRAGLVEAPKHPGWRQLVAVKGHVIPLEQVHHRRRAIDALLHHIGEHLTHGVERWAVGHGDADDVDDFADKARRRIGTDPEFVVPLGPTVGAHAGPGALVLGFVAAS